MTTITIADNIYATASGASIDDIEKLLRYKMPGFQFSPAGKRGWNGWINLASADIEDNTVTFPAGLVSYVMGQPWARSWSLLDEREVPAFKPLYSPDELGDLEPHQLECVEDAVHNRQGLVQYPTGVGKGRIIGELVRRLGVPLLVIVDKIDLVKQLGDEIELCIGKPVGRIGGGQFSVEDCTIGTFQSLSKLLHSRPSLNKYMLDPAKYFWPLWKGVINDEGHHTEAKTFAQCLQQLSAAYYRFSFSATIFKSYEGKKHDPTYLKVQSFIGPPIATMSVSAGIDTGRIVPVDIFLIKPPSLNIGFVTRSTCSLHGPQPAPPPGEPFVPACGCPFNYREEYEARTVRNPGRNELITRLAQRLRQLGPTVVLVNRLEHGELLAHTIAAPFVSGQSKDREKYYDGFKRWVYVNTFPCLVLSSIADEALDLPSIEYLIMAGGGKADHRQIQRLGRGMRASAGKESLTAFDFADEGKHVASHYRRRRRLYDREPAYTAVDLTVEDLKEWGI